MRGLFIGWSKSDAAVEWKLSRTVARNYNLLVLNLARLIPIAAILALVSMLFATHLLRSKAQPRLYLWAWQRPEKLSGVDPDRIAVAYLAGTIRLTGAKVLVERRQQPLSVAKGATTMVVIRIETSLKQPPLLDVAQQETTITAIDQLAAKHPVEQLQLDFDATVSQREFYRGLVAGLRRRNPNLYISITALTSWCLHDRWMTGLPVDEAVPMLFRMGPDAAVVREKLDRGEDFQEPLCRSSYGVSLDEPVPRLRKGRRVYWFNPRPWAGRDIEKAMRASE